MSAMETVNSRIEKIEKLKQLLDTKQGLKEASSEFPSKQEITSKTSTLVERDNPVVNDILPISQFYIGSPDGEDNEQSLVKLAQRWDVDIDEPISNSLSSEAQAFESVQTELRNRQKLLQQQKTANRSIESLQHELKKAEKSLSQVRGAKRTERAAALVVLPFFILGLWALIALGEMAFVFVKQIGVL